ncbi:hypothetical protein GCM10011571_08740 [Marinithermofilum abyssi]|uniref:Uncharacterized protein n=1 Tax=Marinithermofilum abyssi TaxID=1571185 RepID=A0A8J2VGJ3_9BACL|nr:hypothetical protein [Marinithermofilum abyssi]GGE09675.1 hypothetical protein GCM10011571_08740 [Marinithermofilum abyssi]
MSIVIQSKGLEEKEHPFYIFRYAIKKDGNSYLESLARYVHSEKGGKVQFMEPDMRKIQQLPNAIEQLNEVERVIKEEAKLVMEQPDE